MVETFLERGNQLASSRNLMKQDSAYTAAIALVAIHSAIALNDALLFRLTARHEHSENHMDAVIRTKKQCMSRKIPANGLVHLEKLVRAKSKVSYSSEKTTFDFADTLAVASERFEAWVRPLLKRTS